MNNDKARPIVSKFRKPNPQSGLGLISWIIIIVIMIAILSYYGVNIQRAFASPTAQSNFSYVWGGVTYAWYHYLQAPVTYLWNVIVVGIIWDVLLAPLLHHLQASSATTGS